MTSASLSPGPQTPWYALESRAVLTALDTDTDGLSSTAAAERLDRFGPNALEAAAGAPWWRILLRQSKSPLIAILFVAGVITSIQQHWIDAIAIYLVLVINSALGFWQERKAEREVRALASMSVTTVRVRRDGATVKLAADRLVPGDVVVLDSGDQVPADLRLLDVNALQVDESMLTGESLATRKDVEAVPEDTPIGDRRGLAFSGTFVTSGRATGVVVETGRRTELGAISELIQGPAVRTPLQLLTDRLEKWIGLAILAAVLFTFGAGLIGGYTVEEMFRTAVALSVASIPESLPIIFTVAMSVGVARMAKRHAIVRTLPAVETLGSTTVIASDKTGTLTQNKLTVEQVWTADGTWRPDDPVGPATRHTLRAGVLTNEAVRDEAGDLQGDAVDVAMAEVALAAGAADEDERVRPPIAFTPYEPALRYSQTVRRTDDGRLALYVKGQPDVIAALCDRLAVGDSDKSMVVETVMAANDALAAEGLRVLATAHRILDDDVPLTGALPAPEGLVFLGLEGMTDPPRDGVAQAIADCRQAGIAVKMITGDQPATAQAIARRLGLESPVPPMTGAEMAGLSDDELAQRLEQATVAARVSPHDKLRIVDALGERGEVVAVTGDGVNDAPALKAAAIGVAMGRDGTDVAREAADLVLTDDDFVTIVDAVEQGRVTFAAIRKATFFLLSTAVAGVLALSINVVLDQPLLFLPVQILWINLVTSGIQDVALALEPAEGDELHRPPRPRSEGVLSRTLWIRTFLTGAWMGAAVLAVYAWALHDGSSTEHARTMALTTFVLFNFIQVGNARTEHRSLLTLNPLRNKVLGAAAVGSILLLWAVMSWSVSANVLGIVPISVAEWALCGAVALTVLVLVESDKLVRALARRRRAVPAYGEG